MPGVFSSCIISCRPGLSSDDRLIKGGERRRRIRGFSSVGDSSCGSGTCRTSSFATCYSNSSTIRSDTTIRSSKSDDTSSSRSTSSSSGIQTTTSNSSKNYSAAATETATRRSNPCRAFYSNKENTAMIFTNHHDRNDEHFGSSSRQHQRKRQYQPSLSPSPLPCVWGYFVDTA